MLQVELKHCRTRTFDLALTGSTSMPWLICWLARKRPPVGDTDDDAVPEESGITVSRRATSGLAANTG